MKAIDVLLRQYRVEHACGVNLSGQRKLNENAVNARVLIEATDNAEHVFGGRRSRQPIGDVVQAEVLAGCGLARHIDVRCGVVANEESPKARSRASAVD